MTRPEVGKRAEAHARLMAALQIAKERGERIPCIGDPDMWDGEHAELQQAARYGCQVCEQITACRQYVTAFPEPEGVWSGLTPKEQAQLHRESIE